MVEEVKSMIVIVIRKDCIDAILESVVKTYGYQAA